MESSLGAWIPVGRLRKPPAKKSKTIDRQEIKALVAEMEQRGELPRNSEIHNRNERESISLQTAAVQERQLRSVLDCVAAERGYVPQTHQVGSLTRAFTSLDESSASLVTAVLNNSPKTTSRLSTLSNTLFSRQQRLQQMFGKRSRTDQSVPLLLNRLIVAHPIHTEAKAMEEENQEILQEERKELSNFISLHQAHDVAGAFLNRHSEILTEKTKAHLIRLAQLETHSSKRAPSPQQQQSSGMEGRETALSILNAADRLLSFDVPLVIESIRIAPPPPATIVAQAKSQTHPARLARSDLLTVHLSEAEQQKGTVVPKKSITLLKKVEEEIEEALDDTFLDATADSIFAQVDRIRSIHAANMYLKRIEETWRRQASQAEAMAREWNELNELAHQI